jgi:hypothetical protein
VWTVLVISRYAEVTAPALYGRDVNLYWDLRFIPDVVAMVTRVAPIWLIVLCVGAAALLLALLFQLLRWALITAIATVTMMFWAGKWVSDKPERVVFSTPVTKTYARQVQLVAAAQSRAKTLEASPPMNSDLEYVKGADVFLIFLESYGAVSYERHDISDRLVGSRKELVAAIHDTHRSVVSAYVESPTFGGSSWLAHLSLLSGIEVRDPDTNAMLMSQQRDTLVRTFGRRAFEPWR